MTYLKGLRPKNLIGGTFGSYGWSGEGNKMLNQILSDMGVELINEGLRVKYVPTENDLNECYTYGQQIAQALKHKLSTTC